MDNFSFLSNADPAYIDDLYRKYQQDPNAVDQAWSTFFKGFDFARANYDEGSAGLQTPDEFKVINLINAYRQRGHLFTKTNPVRTRRNYSPNLDIANFGLKESDMQKEFLAGEEIGIGKATLARIIEHLQQTYTQSIGAEFAFIRNPEQFEWLKKRMESSRNQTELSREDRTHYFTKIVQAVGFEQFLHRRFTGQKRFSLEGNESLIPALDAIIEKGASIGAEEFVIGMAHRGRLNVLANIMDKPKAHIFSEFTHKEFDDEKLMGDVKYHLGGSITHKTGQNKEIMITLAPNPSHLETVGPVVTGIARAHIDHFYAGDTDKVVPIIIHGDASVAGQGVVYELLQMSDVKAHDVGGSIHLVVNNQIGFTTNYLDGRSSIYCTDVAKTVQSPIFHVNADDVEAVVFTIELAMEYREKFDKDVFVDLLGYRRFGHNEGDEPRFTQPTLYSAIEKHPNVREIYSSLLMKEHGYSQEELEKIRQQVDDDLESDFLVSQELKKTPTNPFLGRLWTDFTYATADDFTHSPPTGVAEEILRDLGTRITALPEGKAFNRKLVKLMNDRRAMLEGEGKLDWAMAELLAYATLLNEGRSVRFSGQDSQRGTFSHRHAVLTIENSEEKYTPLANLKPDQPSFEIYNSILSEYAVMGFEYGFAMASPNTLTIWEAQFGDFVNGAQIVIDQYISSAEEKWKVMNGLVLLLPHGYEGQGPEHSSGRIERILQLCADNNMRVANCTTPANFFHLLRRQLEGNIRKPLVVFTPKSLLRHPDVVSSFSELSSGSFQEVIDDDTVDKEKVKRVIFVSGKLYYDLVAERAKRGATDAIIRIEQYYPFPAQQIEEILERYPNATTHVWSQEEPANMGAWSFMMRNFKLKTLALVSRPESGSPATGSTWLHNLRQRKIVEKSFGLCTCENANEICKRTCAPHEWSHIKEEL